MSDGEWASVKLKFDSQKSTKTSLALSSTLAGGQERDEAYRWQIDPSEVELGRKLGKGAFGTVFKGKLRGKEVAVKKLHVQDLDEDALEDFKAEVEIMSKLRHPNVVLFMGCCLQPGQYMMVTELMPKGSVYDLLRDKANPLSFKQRMAMARDAALGMNWLHCSKPPFIHRDLKTQNLLVDDNWNVKVADFGLSHIKKHGERGLRGSYGAIGTPLWMAPEVLQNKPYDESADVYSFGIVLWELLTQEDPFPEIESFSAMIDTVVGDQRRPEIPEKCPSKLKELIEVCWSPDASVRPTFADIIPQFNEIIVDGIITDEMGRKMWKKYFLKDKLRDVVSWRNFVIGLTNIFKQRMPKDPDDTRWKCLKALVCDAKEKVTIEQFSMILDWFGPMQDLDSFLDSIEDLLKKTWFHGDISSTEAEQRLANEKKGTFLVRFSSRDPGCYAISTMSQGGRLKHFRIYHKPGLDYLIGKTECPSLEAIVTKYHKELFLKTACPGSKFQSIFNTNKKNVCAGYLVPEFDS